MNKLIIFLLIMFSSTAAAEYTYVQPPERITQDHDPSVTILTYKGKQYEPVKIQEIPSYMERKYKAVRDATKVSQEKSTKGYPLGK